MVILLNCSFVQAQNFFMFVLNTASSAAGELSDARTASILCNQLSFSENRSSFENFLFKKTNFSLVLCLLQQYKMLIINIDIDSICVWQESHYESQRNDC